MCVCVCINSNLLIHPPFPFSILYQKFVLYFCVSLVAFKIVSLSVLLKTGLWERLMWLSSCFLCPDSMGLFEAPIWCFTFSLNLKNFQICLQILSMSPLPSLVDTLITHILGLLKFSTLLMLYSFYVKTFFYPVLLILESPLSMSSSLWIFSPTISNLP